MSIEVLRKIIRSAPKKPGVYFFRNQSGKFLYIGKAINIRSRLLNYPRSADTRIKQMLKGAASADFKTTNSEIEALILESRLIKKHKPIFNIVMRDDKQYSFVIFTEENFPKIYAGHQPGKFDAIGPFTDAGALKTTLRLLRRQFPYCTCKQKHYVRCLNAHIGKCLGFCCLKQQKPNDEVRTSNEKIYRQNIRAIKEILSGKRVTLIRQLEKEMTALGKIGQYEKAIELRGKIERVKRVFENASIIRNSSFLLRHSSDSKPADHLKQLQQLVKLDRLPDRIEGYDIANIQGQHATGSMVVFTNGQPDKNQYRKFNIRLLNKYDRTNLAVPTHTPSNPRTLSGGDTAMLSQILIRRFNHPEWPLPDLIIVDGGKAQLGAASAAITNYHLSIFNENLKTGKSLENKKWKMKTIPVIALTKNEYHRGDHIYISNRKLPIKLKNLPEQVRNIILQIDSEAHRFAISHYRKLHRRTLNNKAH